MKQVHTPSAPVEIEKTMTEEEPQRVQHQLTRPVIQEVFEVKISNICILYLS